jgi:hypothetical protein
MRNQFVSSLDFLNILWERYKIVFDLLSLLRYMKYLYPYECEKLQLSSPGELQAAIGNACFR